MKSCPISFQGRPEVVFDVLFHVVMLSMVLQVIFELKLSLLERDHIHKLVENALWSTLGKLVTGPKLPSETFDVMDALLGDDEQHHEINRMIVSRNRVFVGMMALACAGYYLTLSQTCRADKSPEALGSVLKNNLALLAVVGTLEGLFVWLVILEYSPIKPSELQKVVVDRIRNVATPRETQEELESQGRRPGYLMMLLPALLGLTSSAIRKRYPFLSNVTWVGAMATCIVAVVFASFGLTQDVECSAIEKPCGSNLSPLLRYGVYAAVLAVLIGLSRVYSPPNSFSPSCILWQGFAISTVVSSLFLTLGAEQERLVLKSTVGRIVDSYLQRIYQSAEVVNAPGAQAVAAKLAEALDSYEVPVDEDMKVKEHNVSLLVYAGGIVGGTLLCAIVCTLVEGKFQQRRDNKVELWERGRESALKRLFLGASLAGSCSLLAEFHFLTSMLAPTRPLSVTKVNRMITDILRSNLQK